ncbi:MAG TPA: hypothetical protein VGO24_03755 [Solirubrobacterales bacterium]|jgi:hypothetical protein|nr:hypothetical protein [Solirubrobacterales bacterium]
MRIAALYDAHGRILAAAPIDEERGGPVPVATEGTEVHTFEVPENAARMRLDEICTSFRVDVGARQLRDGRESAS